MKKGRFFTKRNIGRISALVVATTLIVMPVSASIADENEKIENIKSDVYVDKTNEIIDESKDADIKTEVIEKENISNIDKTEGEASSKKSDDELIENEEENESNINDESGINDANPDVTDELSDGTGNEINGEPKAKKLLLGAPAPSPDPVEICNNGYPYAYDYQEEYNTIVLALDLPVDIPSDTTFQWQFSDSENGPFEDITSEEDTTYGKESSLVVEGVNRRWFRCVVNGNEENVSKAVMTIDPKNDPGYNPEYFGCGYYISNGKMAYKVHSDKEFDIIGVYEKDEEKYWVNTSYNDYWSVMSSTEANPESSTSLYGDGVKCIMMSFDEENSSVVRVKCILNPEYHSMVVGTDTMLGNVSTYPYSDSASLKAIIDKDSLKQVQIVAALSLKDATDNSCAFVFKPNTKPSYFWIGSYNQCKKGGAYCYNEMASVDDLYDELLPQYIEYVYEELYYDCLDEGMSEEEAEVYASQTIEDNRSEIEEYVRQMIVEMSSEYDSCYIYSSFRGKRVVGEVVGEDSAMSISWTNIQDGVVEFQYNVGKVSETGAITQSIPTSYDITIPKINPNYYYALYDEDGNRMTPWTNTPNAGVDPDHLTDIRFEGLDPDTKYVVKNIPKSAYESNPDDPDLSGAEDEDVRTNIDPVEPTPEEKESGVKAAVITPKSRTIYLEHPRKDHEYALAEIYNGREYVVTPYKTVGGDDSVLFDQTEDYGDIYPLVPGKQYYIVAKSSDNLSSDKTPVKTLNAAIFVDSYEECYMDDDDLEWFFESYGQYGPSTYAEIYDIKDGAKINPPKSPDKNGKIFESWLYEDENGNFVPWDFENGTVNKNMVFYAKWSDENHEHSWIYSYSKASPNTLKAYCKADTGIKCTHYGESLAECEDPLKAVVKAANATYTGSEYDTYNNIDLFDSIGGADSSNGFDDSYKVYVDENRTVPTTTENSGAASEGGAPVNVGTYWITYNYIGSGNQTYLLTTSFKITPMTLGNADMILNQYDFAYTGETIAPTVQFNSELDLTEGVDYDFSPESVNDATDIGLYKVAVEFKGNYKGTAVKSWRITDATPPTGVIDVDELGTFDDFSNSPGGVTYFTSGRKITISAHDAETEESDISVYYYIATSDYSKDEVAAFPESKWSKIANGSGFTLSDERLYKIYVKIVDGSGRELYLSTDKFVIDKTAPEVIGIKEGNKYCNKTPFTVSDKVSGIMSILVNGTDIYRSSKTSYTLDGDYDSPDMEYTVEVIDNAGNSVKITGIKLFVESEHKWKDGNIIKESTCTERGKREQTCSVCGAKRERELSLKNHVYDFDNDKNWKVDWSYDEINEVYRCVSYLYCSNGCGNYKKYDEAHNKIEKTIKSDGTIVYTCTVTDDSGSGKTKDFIMESKPTADKESVGENELNTSVIATPGAPGVTVSGFTPEKSKSNLSIYEFNSLNETDDDINTTIDEFMIVKDINPSIDSADKEMAQDNLKDYLGEEELPKVSYLDMSLFKSFKEEKVDEDGNVIDIVSESMQQIYDYKNDITININVNELGFEPVKSGMRRIYYVSRVHEYDYGKNAEVIFEGFDRNGMISIKTQLFCPFAITYKDIPGGTPTPGPDEPGSDPTGSSGSNNTQVLQTATAPVNVTMYTSPQTGDNSHVVLWSIIGVVFAALFVLMTIFLKDTGLFKIIRRLF